MFTALFLFALFIAAALWLGFSAVYLAVLLVFKTLWFGLSFLFSLGRLAVFVFLVLPLFLIVLLVKLSGLLFLLAGAALVVLFIGAVIKLFSGAGHAPASAYATEPRPWREPPSREETPREQAIRRLNEALRRMERRTADLEAAMRRHAR